VIWTLPTLPVLAVAVPAVAALTLAVLPRVKGAVIGLHWAIKRNEGQVPGQDDNPLWTPHQSD